MQQAVVSLVGDGPSVLSGCSATGVVAGLAVAQVVEVTSMATGAVAVGEISALNHEVVNNTMEDCAIVRSVFNKGLKVLNMLWCQLRMQFNHDGAAFVIAPCHLQFNHIRCGTAVVGQVQSCQHQDNGQQNGYRTSRCGCPVVDESRKTGLTDSFVLHFIEQVIVQTVCFLVLGIGLSRVTQQSGGGAILASVGVVLGQKPRPVSSKAKGRGVLSTRVRFSKNVER